MKRYFKPFLTIIICLFFKISFSQNTNETWHPIIKNGKVGYINKKGKIVETPTYTRLNSYELQNATGDFFIASLDHGEMIFTKKDKKLLINDVYDKIKIDEQHKLIKVTNYGNRDEIFAQDTYGFYDFNGKNVIPVKLKTGLFSFSYSDNFHEGLISFEDEKTNRNGYMDVNGNIVIKPQYNSANSFHNGLAAVLKNELYGYINKHGKEVIDFKYERITDFNENGYALVKLKAKGPSMIIDKNGNIVKAKLPYQPATEYTNFHNGLCLVYDSTIKKYGYINERGDLVVDLKYSHAKDFENGYAVVDMYSSSSALGLWTVIDPTGKEMFTPIAAEYMGGYNDGLIDIRQNKLYGFIDIKGKTIIAPTWTNNPHFQDGLAMITEESTEKGEPFYGMETYMQKIGYIDKTGKIIWPISE
ncbi:MAG: WG repeat-containing protein [Bacteroidota bacterium]